MEVRSEAGIMASREPFTLNLQKSSVQTQPSMQNMRLAFGPDGTAIYKQVSSSTSPPPPPPPPYSAAAAPAGDGAAPAQSIAMSHGLNMNMNMSMNMNMGEQIKRKRGRPRKYGPERTMSLALTSASSPPSNTAAAASGGGGGGSGYSAGTPSSMASPSAASAAASAMKKARGRPPGSGKKHQMSSIGSVGTAFTPHVVTVKAGEDVSSVIMSFLNHGPRAVCVLSANGAISDVTLRQPATSGGTVTYEGRFEILSLCGSYLLSEYGGQRSRTGGLSVSLAGSDGRILGGGVAGILTAASPVQVVVGSFFVDGKKELKKSQALLDPPTLGSKFPQFGTPGGAGSPISRGTLSESSGGVPGSPLHQSTGVSNGSQQGMSNMTWK